MKKNLLKVLSTLLISCNLFAVPASANTWHKIIGYNGDNITWEMCDDNGERIGDSLLIVWNYTHSNDRTPCYLLKYERWHQHQSPWRNERWR